VRQRGFSLVEVLVVSAIALTLVGFGAALTRASHPFAMRSASVQFDAAIAYARSLAATSGNGATIVFLPRTDAAGIALPGFTARVYVGRPDAVGPIRAAEIPPLQADGSITEASLGVPPFSVFIDSAGHASGMTGTVTTATYLAGDPGCPGSGTMAFRLSGTRASATRTLPCPQPDPGPATPP
jgi:prepilin-type N-terminal cleavage/methylation domain-containing protein